MTNAEAIETLRANYPDACFEQLREAVDVAIQALSADAVSVKPGKWEWNTNNGFYYCSNCQRVSPKEDQDGEYCDCPNYCPGCGAKMEV